MIEKIKVGKNTLKVNIHQNNSGLQPQDLFGIGYRYNNPKRSFMFINKYLGKHFAISVDKLRYIGRRLAYLHSLNSLKDKKSLVIGFAEAGTALAHYFSDYLPGETSYVHSTRDTVEDMSSMITFEEAHSHAPNHNFYLADKSLLRDAEEVILVDDEITTGNTAIAIIKELYNHYDKRDFSVVTVLDWRTVDERKAFQELETELGISIHVVAMISGSLPTKSIKPHVNNYVLESTPSPEWATECKPIWYEMALSFSEEPFVNTPYLKHSGRFGLNPKEKLKLERDLEVNTRRLAANILQGKTLVLGYGELLYIPSRIAEILDQKEGFEVYFQSITRTPNMAIDEDSYLIKHVSVFDSVEESGRTDFLYNLPAGEYDNIILILERPMEEDMLSSIKEVINSLGVYYPVLVTLTGNKVW